jgi:hypothetical protein
MSTSATQVSEMTIQSIGIPDGSAFGPDNGRGHRGAFVDT